MKKMLLSSYPQCNRTKLRFTKEQKVSELLRKLGITITLSKITLMGGVLF